MTNFLCAKVCYCEQKERRSTLPSVIPAEEAVEKHTLSSRQYIKVAEKKNGFRRI
jgi:hypothetical protein